MFNFGTYMYEIFFLTKLNGNEMYKMYMYTVVHVLFNINVSLIIQVLQMKD